MRPRDLFLGFIAAVFLFSGCGGAQKKPTRQATGDILLGHELLRKRDLDGALAEFQVALDQEPSPEAELRVGCVHYLMGDKSAAKAAFESYLRQKPDAPKWDRDEVSAQIERIEQNPSEEDERAQNSVAGRRLRAEYLLLQADAALAKEDFGKAASNYEAAAEVIPNTDLWFEAALLSSRAGAYESARRQYRAFLKEAKDGLDERLAFSVQAEIFRLDAIIEGKNSASGESLADRVFKARESGEDFLTKAAEHSMEEVSAAEPEPEEETAKEEENAQVDKAKEEAPPLTAKQKRALEREAKREARRLKKERLKAERKAKAEEKERKRAERRAAAKAKAEEKKREREERRAQKNAKGKKEEVEETIPADVDSSQEVAKGEGEDSPYGQTAQPQASESSPSGTGDTQKSSPSIEALLKYCESPSSAVRMKAVKELARNPDPRVTRALEERLLKDSSVQVRMGAADALVIRNSTKSISVLQRAIMNSSNSVERANLHKAIRHLTGTDRVKDVMPNLDQ